MKALICGFVLAIFSMSASVVHAQSCTGNINFFLGAKSMEKDDWAPIEDQGEIGVLIDFKQDTWPVSIAIDLLHSSDRATLEGFRFDGRTTELNLGVRKIWDHFPMIRPYIGGGLALINAELEGSSFGIRVSDDDTSAGIWLNGGIYWTLGSAFNIGLDLRYSKAEVTVFGVDVEAGGGHAGLILGYHW